MISYIGLIFTIIAAVFGSGSIWGFVYYILQKKSATHQMLLGLGFNSIVESCEYHLERGYIPLNEYEDLVQYLYEPYVKMGGNGTAKALMEKVKALPNKPKEGDK